MSLANPRSRAVALVLLFLLSSASPAAPAVSAAEIVRAIEARYRSAATWRATFLERYSESRNDVRIESGTVFFSRPGRMRWEYEVPEPKLFLVDGKTAWFYVPADRTVTRAPIRQSADWHTPLALLVGKAKLSRVCRTVELLPDGRPEASEPPPAASAASHHRLRCLPKSPDAGFREVLLEVDLTYRISRILIREPAGIETEFRFAAWQENLSLPEAIFHFAAPAGVAIVNQPDLPTPVR